MLANKQLGEGAPIFCLAIKAPVDGATTRKLLSGKGILATKLALSRDDWQHFQLTRLQGRKARPFGSALLAQMNGLFSPPVQYGGEVQGGFVLLALGTEHTTLDRRWLPQLVVRFNPPLVFSV
jgi:hypothetical protein